MCIAVTEFRSKVVSGQILVRSNSRKSHTENLPKPKHGKATKFYIESWMSFNFTPSPMLCQSWFVVGVQASDWTSMCRNLVAALHVSWCFIKNVLKSDMYVKSGACKFLHFWWRMWNDHDVLYSRLYVTPKNQSYQLCYVFVNLQKFEKYFY